MGFWNRGRRREITSTDDAGCFERHLQRRRHNPLFPMDRQDVSEIEIHHARQRDNDERAALRSQIVEILRPMLEGPDSTDEQMAVDLLETIHHLIERVCESDQGLQQEAAALLQGYQRLSESMRIRRSSEQCATLDAAAGALRAQSALLNSPLLATLSRHDSPMRPDELVPSILGLPLSQISPCLDGIRTFAGDSLPSTVAQAIQLMEWASRHGVHISEADEKLRLLEEIAS
jgi:hypothetical protein